MDATQTTFLVLFLAMFAFFVLLAIFVFVRVIRPWLRAFLHGTPVSMIQVLAMRLRGNSPWLLIDAYIALKRSDLSVTIGDVENAYIDGRSHIVTSDDLVEWVKKRSKT